jgi:hypothetical protein
MLRIIPGYGLHGMARWSEMVRCAAFWVSVIVAAHWAADRDPPLRVLSIRTTEGPRGGQAHIEVVVHRAMRGCSVRVSQALVDASGFRYEPTEPRTFSAAAIEEAAREEPARLALDVPIPQHAAAGRALFVLSLDYACNPLHQFWPIPVQMSVPIQLT